MTDSGANSIEGVEARVLALIDKVREARDENSELRGEISRLKKDLREAHAELVGLQKKYDDLQLAQASIHLSKGDVKTAKKRMTDIINKVDYCIAKLSE